MGASFDDLRIADISTFLTVRRAGSLSAAARELKVTVSQVSKAVERLSALLGQRLVARTARGIAVTAEGHAIATQLEEVVARLQAACRAEAASRPLTVAGASFLLSFLVPEIAAALPGTSIRGLELPPALVRAYATEGLYDIAVTFGHEPFADAWVSQPIGDGRKALFASPALAKKLEPFPAPVDRVRPIPFINPTYFSGGQFVPGEDDCPLHRSERRGGHETPTIVLALEMAARIQALVFGPAIAARSLLARGALVEIPVRGWNVSSPVFMTCHGDRVRAHTQKTLVRVLREVMADG